jgi:hypothetical protein
MKKLVNFLAAVAMMGGVMMTQSCSKACDPGYEGSDCKTAWSTKMAKTWSATETPTAGGTASAPYSVTISSSAANGIDLSILNLGKYTCVTTSGSSAVTFKGTMTSSTTFAINDSTCGYHMTASGTLTSGKVNGTYTTTYTLSGVPTTDAYTFVLQ